MTTKMMQPAIPAAKNVLGREVLYRFLMRWPMWNSFHCVWLQVHGRLPQPNDGPLICYLNHPTWWDAYMAMIVDMVILQRRFDTYAMMEELPAYRFFRWCGAFSIDRTNPREVMRSIGYVSHLLSERPGRATIIFPQGEIAPNDQRPLVLHAGLAHIVKRVGYVVLCPVALRYEFRGEERPEVFIRFGPMHRATAPVDVQALTEDVRQRLTHSADALRDAVIANDTSAFCVLLRGRPSVNRVFDMVVGRK